ncbi:hypothetical protein GTZ97_02510 [Aquabacterium fontiphilum]|uniref:lipopolysaccharide biosynthesis protein n=1 Tax=Aquabacterium fontiphilum TaxID=450365 RepID=UPI0013770DC4|nr:hypothetical protein [Aquabacterium fontiphilum]NBD19546.1 hypothetical protein [Aquabacterium fontiphilum]
MSRFRLSLTYGALEQIGVRVCDLVAMWLLMRTLPEADLATYGVATALLFVFSLVLVTPEAALMRDKKKWQAEGALKSYLSGMLLFAWLRVLVVGMLAFGVAATHGLHQTFTYACLLACGVQLIQLAEVARLEHRVDMAHATVFKVELWAKIGFLACSALMFVRPGLQVYVGIYIGWYLVVALYWHMRLVRKHGLSWVPAWRHLPRAFDALRAFAFWQHLSGVVTYVMYNIDPWILARFGTPVSDVALYTAVLKISALFFAVPMFLQNMVAVFLVNSEAGLARVQRFRKMFFVNAGISAAQYAFFMLFGTWLATVFRGQDTSAEAFHGLGLVIGLGVLILNLVRPVMADLILHANMRALLITAYLPALLLSAVAYVALTALYGMEGCAWASTLSYTIFAALILVHGWSSDTVKQTFRLRGGHG